MPVVYLALGSNLGNRKANLVSAIGAMTRLAKVTEASSLYETVPVGPEQPSFLNAVVSIETGLRPDALLRFLKGIEEEVGRRPGGQRNGPRPIDIDILLYGDEVVDSPGLAIPHPGLPQRPFVLVPLAEIAPGLRHPVIDQTVAELAVAAGDEGVTMAEPRGWDGIAGRPTDPVRI
jgi:2-amino-4-hydroxy-6-hydroxymethyldihydropteridine diphosphokinase